MTVAIRPLVDAEVGAADARLPLHRLDRGDGFYLVAWQDGEPAGHAYLALTSPLEVQDMYVLPELRGRGIGAALLRAAEDEACTRGAARITLTVGVDNARARRLYERHGYADCEIPPKRVTGTILIRGEPHDVDDTLITLAKDLPPAPAHRVALERVDGGEATAGMRRTSPPAMPTSPEPLPRHL